MRHHAFAAAMGVLTAAFLAPSSQSQAAASIDPTGFWMKPDAERESKIQVFKCGKGKTQLCAKIAWLKEPTDSRGQPLHDVRNEEPSMRDRPVVGLTIFTGLTPSAPGTWTGKIYNPEDGHTYSATLTVVSGKQILLRGCKAWLLCGEKRWRRTTAPEELMPAAPAEGTEQIEASADPAIPRLTPSNADSTAVVQPAAAAAAEMVASTAPAQSPGVESESQAMAEPQARGETQSAEALPKPTSLPVQEIAVPAAPPSQYNARQGYGFLNISAEPRSAERLSGENVSSMIVMSEPITTQSSKEQAASAPVAKDVEPVPLPTQKPKAIAVAASKPAPTLASQAKAAEQPLPTENSEQADPDAQPAQTAQSAEADAAMTEPPPLTRRQKRLLRRHQQQEEPWFPWLR